MKGYGELSIPMVARLAEAGGRVSLPLFVDQWTRNGSEDLMAADITAFAHTPVRDMDEAAVALMKEKNVHVITTLAVHGSFSRRRFDDLSFLDEPIIGDTTPPFFLEELRSRKPGEPSEIERARQRMKRGKANAKKPFDSGILLAAGTVAPGRIASLLVVEGRPDRNISDTKRVAMVVLRGKILDRSALRFDPSTDPGFRTSSSVSSN